MACLNVYINSADGSHATVSGECEDHWYAPVDAVRDYQVRFTTAHQVTDFVSHEPAYPATRCGRGKVHISRYVDINLELAGAGQLFDRNIHRCLLAKVCSIGYHNIPAKMTQASASGRQAVHCRWLTSGEKIRAAKSTLHRCGQSIGTGA